MIVEYKYHLKKDTSNYLIVRFGNVIGSAGSAITLFIEQVKQGGPIVVKNKKTRRYFMSIEEAVELVIEAKDDNIDLFLNEAADLMYHYLILLSAKNTSLNDVIEILEERHKVQINHK